MKIGMIFECQKGGPDQLVCESLVKRLKAEHNIEIELANSVTLANKRNLRESCGKHVAALLEIENCDRVIIVWDLEPSWKQRTPACRHEDKELILASIKSAGVTDLAKVHLVCIEKMLEAWLLADHRAIAATIQRQTSRSVNISAQRRSETVADPKQVLDRLFRNARTSGYKDYMHAKIIVEALPDLAKISRCATFKRFALKATGINL
jgi:hypothetical protein